MSVSARYLFEGAWYAFEQCGLLLYDAVILRDKGRHGTAVGLAMIAREEQGKGEALLRLWREVEEDGRTVTVERMREACENHGEKRTEAQPAAVETAGGSGRLLTRLHTLVKRKLENSERRAAKRALDAIDEVQRSFHVDPMSGRRPAAMSADEATMLLDHAISDYALCWNRFRREDALEEVDPNLAAAVKAWPDRPELLPPPQLGSESDDHKPRLSPPQPSLWRRVRGVVRRFRGTGIARETNRVDPQEKQRT